MTTRIAVLGAGFGGLELSTVLSEALGDKVAVTLIDKSDAFVFGYSKLEVLFGRATLDAVRLPYRNFSKPGVRFVQETITAIDPQQRRVTTRTGTHDADYLVVALGADYDFAATPGLLEGGNEFYTLPGRNVCAARFPISRRATPSLALPPRPTNARPHRASVRCCCTTTSPPGGCAAAVRSRWSCP